MTIPIKRAYYSVAGLYRDDLDVKALTPGGAELTVQRKTIVRRGESKVIWRVRREKREPGRLMRYTYEDLPAHVEITRWRPINPATWPDPLPSPAKIEGDVAWQTPPAPVTPPDPDDELDWPGPYSEPPDISLRECEVRLLRAVRRAKAKPTTWVGSSWP